MSMIKANTWRETSSPTLIWIRSRGVYGVVTCTPFFNLNLKIRKKLIEEKKRIDNISVLFLWLHIFTT